MPANVEEKCKKTVELLKSFSVSAKFIEINGIFVFNWTANTIEKCSWGETRKENCWRKKFVGANIFVALKNWKMLQIPHIFSISKLFERQKFVAKYFNFESGNLFLLFFFSANFLSVQKSWKSYRAAVLEWKFSKLFILKIFLYNPTKL